MKDNDENNSRRDVWIWAVVAVACAFGVVRLSKTSPRPPIPVQTAVPLPGKPPIDPAADQPAVAEPAPANEEELAEKIRNHRPVQEPSDGFVGSAACRDCHQHNHETWHDSYHRTMTQLATEESVIADFDGRVVKFPNTPDYRLFKQAGQFWADIGQQEDFQFGPPDKRQAFPVVMTTGSHHMQVYWLALGMKRTLGILPLVYLKEEQRWIPRKSAWIAPPDDLNRMAPGSWNSTCIKCHSTHGFDEDHKHEVVPNPGGDPFALYDTKVGEFGISCEACHGPGETHVRRHRDGELAPGEKDLIVDPGNLSHERSSQVCGGCHSISETKTEAHSWLDFHAGLDLRDSRHLSGRDPETVARLKLQHSDVDEEEALKRIHFTMKAEYWPDGAPRGSGTEYTGMKQSGCYQRGKMSCISCHELHQSKTDPRPRQEWADDQLAPGMRTNAACTQCHDAEEFGPKHTHHAADSAGSLCQNCHMPFSTWGLLKGIRNHTIRSPQVKDSAPEVRPNACNLCHLDQPLQWTADKLHEWHDHPLPRLKPAEQEVGAGLLWTLQGDAAQRAVVAYNFGKPAAQAVSKTDWMIPALSYLIRDPYDAVRHVAGNSLHSLPGYQDFPFEFVAPSRELGRAGLRLMERWNQQPAHTPDPRNLVGNDGKFQKAKATELLKDRNNRVVHVSE